MKARNGDNVETGFGGTASQQLPCFAATMQMLAGWNLLSLPLALPQSDRLSIFPHSTSSDSICLGQLNEHEPQSPFNRQIALRIRQRVGIFFMEE